MNSFFFFFLSTDFQIVHQLNNRCKHSVKSFRGGWDRSEFGLFRSWTNEYPADYYLNFCPASVVYEESEKKKVLVLGINLPLLLSASHGSISNAGMSSRQTGRPYFPLYCTFWSCFFEVNILTKTFLSCMIIHTSVCPKHFILLLLPFVSAFSLLYSLSLSPFLSVFQPCCLSFSIKGKLCHEDRSSSWSQSWTFCLSRKESWASSA